MPANLENSAVATGLEMVSFHSNPKEGQCQRMFKLLHNWPYFTSSKVTIKILQARPQQYVNQEQMFNLDLEKAEEPEVKLPTSIGSQKKQGNSRKTSTSASLTILKLWLCESQETGKFLKRWEYQIPLPISWKTCMQSKEQQLELDMEQLAGPKWRK